jgi:uncharacterized membrane-anchored protein YhcB (DUF1043 family)
MIYCLFLLIGFGVGIFLYSWVKNLYDNTINAFFTGELHKRQMKQKELELELEKVKESIEEYKEKEAK